MGEHIQSNYQNHLKQSRAEKMKNLTILTLAVVFISMHHCKDIGLGSGAVAEGRWWPGTNCQTQTEMSTECCLWRRCNWICGMTPPAAQSSCFSDCDNMCPASNLGWGCSVKC